MNKKQTLRFFLVLLVVFASLPMGLVAQAQGGSPATKPALDNSLMNYCYSGAVSIEKNADGGFTLNVDADALGLTADDMAAIEADIQAFSSAEELQAYLLDGCLGEGAYDEYIIIWEDEAALEEWLLLYEIDGEYLLALWEEYLAYYDELLAYFEELGLAFDDLADLEDFLDLLDYGSTEDLAAFLDESGIEYDEAALEDLEAAEEEFDTALEEGTDEEATDEEATDEAATDEEATDDGSEDDSSGDDGSGDDGSGDDGGGDDGGEG
jgi:hypothetical protein